MSIFSPFIVMTILLSISQGASLTLTPLISAVFKAFSSIY
jgi:hypothetical protein